MHTSSNAGNNRRAAHKAIAIVVATGATLTAGALAAPALATTARPAGYVTVESCGSVAGTLSHTSSAASGGAVLAATISGCARHSSPDAGSGTLVANLSTAPADSASSLSGTFTITWPAASGLNPSSGTLGVTGPDARGGYSVGGSITRGAFTGAVVRTSLAPVRATAADGQPVTNTAPLTVMRNNW